MGYRPIFDGMRINFRRQKKGHSAPALEKITQVQLQPRVSEIHIAFEID
jgi:hypothetical protein